MYKILRADRDGYITNRVIGGSRVVDANVGAAGTLDIFKLYDVTRSGSVPNTEISRALIHFDLKPLSNLVNAGTIDTSNPSFWCKLHLTDVYGGQPTPVDFTIVVFPLSASFEEGFGKNISYYTDVDAANWLSSSVGTLWNISGAAGSGGATTTCDYITASLSIASTKMAQTFRTGTENLVVDVTKIVSATLSGELPDAGFRLSLSASHEEDTKTYFIKRFASRNAFDETKHPRLIFGYDDSIDDDTQNLTFDTSGRIRLYNSIAGGLANLKSGGIDLVGMNCLLLKLEAAVSGSPSFYFTGSQTYSGTKYVSGTYQADVELSSSGTLSPYILQSGSLNFYPIWTSLDKSVTYVTGSKITVSQPKRQNSSGVLQKYIVSVNGIKHDYRTSETINAQVNVFDQSSPLLKVVKVPIETPSIVFPQSYYQIRDSITDEIVVPFDDEKNSTKLSSDGNGMYFKLDADVLTAGRTYVVDVMIKLMGTTRIFESASPIFRIQKSTL